MKKKFVVAENHLQNWFPEVSDSVLIFPKVSDSVFPGGRGI